MIYRWQKVYWYAQIKNGQNFKFVIFTHLFSVIGGSKDFECLSTAYALLYRAEYLTIETEKSDSYLRIVQNS